jgi:hypothetical protein
MYIMNNHVRAAAARIESHSRLLVHCMYCWASNLQLNQALVQAVPVWPGGA